MAKAQPKVIPLNRAARRRQTKQPDEVAVPVGAQNKLREYFGLWKQAEATLTTYVQGLNGALGLEGEWGLNLQKMVMTKVDGKKEAETKKPSNEE